MTDYLVVDSASYAFILVAAAIVIDTMLGVIKAAVSDYDGFDIRELPRFLVTGILPYVGSLVILAMATELIGEPFAALFYPAAAATLAKFVVEIRDKLIDLLGINITHSDGIGEENQEEIDPDAGV